MKKRIKFKIPFFILILTFIPVLVLVTFLSTNNKEEQKEPETESSITPSYPVINENNKIIYPYIDENVKVGKSYYDYKSEEFKQEESLIVHDNVYYQNNTFDVIAIANGTITRVKEDDSLGKTIEIKHDNGLISTYQSLSEVSVKKDDVISQGQVIGKSGINEIDKDLGNHLHLEIYENGISVNPEMYLGKEYEKKN